MKLPEENTETRHLKPLNTINWETIRDTPLPRASASRPRYSMISARLRANTERKRIIQLCSQKLEKKRTKKKFSGRDMRRSVCIKNTYHRLLEEAKKEKEARRGDIRKIEPCADENQTEKRLCKDFDEEFTSILDAIFS